MGFLAGLFEIFLQSGIICATNQGYGTWSRSKWCNIILWEASDGVTLITLCTCACFMQCPLR